MNRIRTLTRVAAVALTATWLLITGVTVAWARPAPPERAPAAPTGATDGGFATWQVLSVAAAGTALAVLVTLVTVHAVTHHHGGRGHAVHA